jgi:ribosomal protein S18 acetylase RimI-like enzyme
VEPFSHRLGVVATGPRALLELWRVAEDEDGELHGIAFAAVREARAATLDIYAAVVPVLRRQGLGRALLEPLLSLPEVALRGRVRDTEPAGRAFLASLGFTDVAAQLSLCWPGHPKPGLPEMPALRIRDAAARDQATVARLSNEAWAGAPDSYGTRADEIAQLFGEEGRLVLLAESEKRPIGYLSAVRLGRTLGIEEVAVLPDFRRMGVGRALLAAALHRDMAGAVLSVNEDNKPARALYRSLGFAQVARRMVMERRNSAEME